jgi:hypothetical protein
MNSFIRAVLLAALIAGTLDLTSAYLDVYVRTGKFASNMFQYISGGALGLDTSMKGGLRVQILGLCIHFFLAFTYTLIFFVAYPRLQLGKYNKYLIGLAYGFLVGMFMTFVILPMTRLPHNPFDWAWALKGWLILACMLGIPISYQANKYYSSIL